MSRYHLRFILVNEYETPQQNKPARTSFQHCRECSIWLVTTTNNVCSTASSYYTHSEARSLACARKNVRQCEKMIMQDQVQGFKLLYLYSDTEYITQWNEEGAQLLCKNIGRIRYTVIESNKILVQYKCMEVCNSKYSYSLYSTVFVEDLRVETPLQSFGFCPSDSTDICPTSEVKTVHCWGVKCPSWRCGLSPSCSWFRCRTLHARGVEGFLENVPGAKSSGEVLSDTYDEIFEVEPDPRVLRRSCQCWCICWPAFSLSRLADVRGKTI